MKCPQQEELFDFIEGEIAQERSHDLQQHITDCESCRSSVEGLRGLANIVVEARDAYANTARQVRIMDAVAAYDAAHAGRAPTWQWWRPLYKGGLALGTVAAIAWLIAVKPPPQKDDAPPQDTLLGLAPRGEREPSSKAGGDAAAPVAVEVFRTGGDEDLATADPEPVRGEIRARDYLLFSYTNATSASSAHRWLAIVGRDAVGRLHWYLPARTPDSASDHAAVSIEAAVFRKEIPRAFRSPGLAAGNLELFFIFSRGILDRRSVEKLASPSAPSVATAKEADEGYVVVRQTVRVVPEPNERRD